jgi:hypothetical protein
VIVAGTESRRELVEVVGSERLRMRMTEASLTACQKAWAQVKAGTAIGSPNGTATQAALTVPVGASAASPERLANSASATSALTLPTVVPDSMADGEPPAPREVPVAPDHVSDLRLAPVQVDGPSPALTGEVGDWLEGEWVTVEEEPNLGG